MLTKEQKQSIYRQFKSIISDHSEYFANLEQLLKHDSFYNANSIEDLENDFEEQILNSESCELIDEDRFDYFIRLSKNDEEYECLMCFNDDIVSATMLFIIYLDVDYNIVFIGLSGD